MHRQKIDKDLIFAQIGQFSPNHVTLEPTYGKHKYLLSPSNLKLDQMSHNEMCFKTLSYSFSNPYYHPNGLYWGHQCSWILTRSK